MAAFHEDAVAAGFGDSLSPTSALLSLLEAPTSLVEAVEQEKEVSQSVCQTNSRFVLSVSVGRR